MVARNASARKRPGIKSGVQGLAKVAAGIGCRRGRLDEPLAGNVRPRPNDQAGMMVRGRHQLGATGGARAAHVVQLRPVGIERPDEELAEKGGSPANRLDRPSRLSAGEGSEVEVMVAMTQSCLFSGGFCRAERFLGR